MNRLIGLLFGILMIGYAIAGSAATNHQTLEQKFTGELKKYTPDALYVRSIADNQMAALVISNHELTRIFVNNDRILAVRGVDGAYLLNKDEVQGEIFVKPTPLYRERTISLFITTEQGHNYTLLLAPANIPARTIELKPTGGSRQAAQWEKNSSYYTLIIKFMTAMVNGKVPDGYAVNVPSKIKSLKFKQILVTLNALYIGKYLRGEVFTLENKTSKSICLDEMQFYQQGARAIAILERNLPPHTKTLLYRVMNNE